MPRVLIVIPARLASTRLPRKPLADIHGEPMIVHCWRRAMAAGVGRVVIAAEADEILAVVRRAGGEAVLTRADHVSGSDRVFEAVGTIDPAGAFDIIVNLQGDLPSLEPRLVQACAAVLDVEGPDIATLAAEIRIEEERTNPNVVKMIGTPLPPGPATTAAGGLDRGRQRALYFTRATAPSGDGPLYHHIGMYAYRRAALERFVSLPPSPLELRERLEQLRALEAGMRIDVAIVDTVPLGVDTPADLDRARQLLKPQAKSGRSANPAGGSARAAKPRPRVTKTVRPAKKKTP